MADDPLRYRAALDKLMYPHALSALRRATPSNKGPPSDPLDDLRGLLRRHRGEILDDAAAQPHLWDYDKVFWGACFSVAGALIVYILGEWIKRGHQSEDLPVLFPLVVAEALFLRSLRKRNRSLISSKRWEVVLKPIEELLVDLAKHDPPHIRVEVSEHPAPDRVAGDSDPNKGDPARGGASRRRV